MQPRKKFSSGPSSGPRSRGRFDDKKREGRPDRPGGGRFFQKKTCRFCADKSILDFKDMDRIRKFLTEKGKIIPRRITGNCAKCQRMLARAVKRARHAALVGFEIA